MMDGFLGQWVAGMGPVLAQWVLVQAVVLLVLAVWVVSLTVALRGARARYAALAAGVDGANLEQLLQRHLADIAHTRDEVAGLGRRLEALADTQRGCLQHVGLVRYDAFDNTAGRLSFALALLDEHRDGVVLNTMVGREASATYAKPVRGGTSDTPLSDEESMALRAALAADSRAQA